MNFIPTILEGCFVIEPKVFEDQRGYFFESFNKKQFYEHTNIAVNFVQDNVSKSSYGVLRGMHFQTGEHAQSKLVSVAQGKVLDVVVDLRKDSETYGKSISMILSDENKKQLYIPKNFAHGFLVLSKTAEFRYKCDNFYNKPSEYGINYKSLDIDWIIAEKDIIINNRDGNLPPLKEFMKH